MKQWYAVYTQPRNEERAQDHLLRQGFDVFLPRYLKRRSHARRVTVVPMPLFPRYLFVSFDPSQQRWRAIRSTRGVIGLVSNGDTPVPVPSDVVSEIERRRDADGYVVLARHLDLKRGMRIRIDSGPFAATEAIFEAKRDDERVIALLTLMGREVVVQLPIRAVAPAG
jgi:transcriptional antiterminator RfaH